MTRLCRSTAMLFAGVVCLATGQACGQATPLNLIVILADDLGYGDLGCYGNQVHRTPHIDRLARQGARFTDFYVTSPVCTPTRIALLTGRHPARLRQFGVLWPPSVGGLPTEEITLAEFLREQGYASGLAGKWHVGHSDPSLLPLAQGFDAWYGMPYPNDMGPFHPQAQRIPGEWPPMPMYRDRRVVERPIDPNLLTQQYHAEAVRFIAENHHRPFFLFLSHAMPHTLLGASGAFRGESRNGLYGDAVEELDWSVGDLIRVLRAFDLAEKTLVVFTSDNGAALPRDPRPEDPRWRHDGSNAPLRGGKGQTFEGGIRVPAIFWRPGAIEAGGVVRSPAVVTDVAATFADLAGLPPMPSAVDSVSIAPLLRGEAPSQDRTLFFGTGDVRAVRRGKWKFLPTAEPSWKNPYVREPMLFDLEADPGETTNVISEFPQIGGELETTIRSYESSFD